MVELRKRKAPELSAPPPIKKANSTKSNASNHKADSAANGAASPKLAVGDSVDLDGFGGEIETNEGEKTTLKTLVDESKNGVVIFTYPKASTPGCEWSRGFFGPSVSDSSCFQLTFARHYPGLLIQRCVYTTDGHRVLYLRPVHRVRILHAVFSLKRKCSYKWLAPEDTLT